MNRKLLFLCLAMLAGQTIFAQRTTLKGVVKDAETEKPLADAAVVVQGSGQVAATDRNGRFTISDVECRVCSLSVTHDGYTPVSLELKGRERTQPIMVSMTRLINTEAQPVDIPTITLAEAEAQEEGAGEIANLLFASRDVFQNASSFGWFPFRFRERGYDSGLFQTYINGAPFNDLETGFTPYSEFGGLNDVLRVRNSTTGLNPAEFAFNGVGGATMVDTRASVQRKQIRVSYATSNRTYRDRIMVTASTGLMPGGWAVSASASKRWSNEGYVPGTFYDGYSYFLSVDKKFGQTQGLNLTFFGAPTRRGRSADSFQEMFDISGSNYYNPLWGYWNGDKRNSSTVYNHLPTAILRYDLSPGQHTNITLTAYGQTGVSDFTRLNFINGLNPAPDYNRRLPSSLEDPAMGAMWAEQLAADESLRQVDWAGLYESNGNAFSTISDANGIPGNTVEGLQSIYIVENQRSKNTEAGANLFLTHTFGDRISLNGGAQYRWYRGENYKLLDDLLGGDFWVDWDFFGNFDSQTNPLARNSDVRTPNHIIYEGDKFGWDYNENIRRANGWLQWQFSLPQFQIFAGAEIGSSSMSRTGNMQNGRFPNRSLGESEKVSFSTYGVKGGVTWKMNGRNYLYANGYYGTRAPLFRNSFVAPRTRDLVVPNLEVSNIQSVEGGYMLRSPNYKARITGYLTDFSNETENIFVSAWSVGRIIDELDLGALDLGDDAAFLEQPVFFGSAILQGVDRRHAGIEAAIEAKPVPSWVFSAAASIGKYIYTSRPDLLLSLDNGGTQIFDGGLVYQENFYVPRTPQTAASFGIKYESRHFWFASLTLNYADNFYYEFDRARRTSRFVSGLTPQSPIWNTIVEQQKAPSAYTLDFFGGKSWRINQNNYIYLNVGINNILNNTDIVISGRESYRNAFRNDVSDPRFYTSELLYGYGLNYFASITWRM
ncbi:MAG: carboxypeptidase-like regulatory domain-containing protein [Saprospiraceae bacterium]